MPASGIAKHWNAVHATGADRVSRAQADPGPALIALDVLDVDPSDAVIDVGGGSGEFAGTLLQRGFTDITVLDLSVEAINARFERYGTEPIDRQIVDVLGWRSEREYRLWHDRCSRLPVAQNRPATLAHQLGPGSAPVASGHYRHCTPSGDSQAFIWLALRETTRPSVPRL